MDPADILSSRLNMDPYLEYQPAFAYTLPIQLLVLGITFTLLCVLGVQLLFTTQYHFPLAPLNYILQFTSILSVIISVVIKIIVVLQTSGANADTWPYSLDYVAVTIPPASWSIGRDGAWFLLQAINSGLANITHIQFLTLLYPSVTEARLIMFVLGPLALASSALTFTALSPSQTILDLGDAIRNVFNSTLLLIFTIALGLWGLFVNRRRAWRTDGGTAIFGTGAIFLAIVSTSFNFVAVREDGIDWLQHLLYAAILWQTWLGWWWWVGSGMGIGEVEDIMERAERKKRKAAKRASRRRADARSKTGSNSSMMRTPTMASMGEFGHASAQAMAGFTSSVTGILRGRTGILSRRLTRTSQREDEHRDAETGRAGSGSRRGARREGDAENIELDDMGNTTSGTRSNGVQPHVRAQTPTRNQTHTRRPGSHTAQVEFSASTYSGSHNQISTTSETSSTSHTPSLHAPQSIGQFVAYPANWLWVYLRRLRRAHEDATKKQALERAELRQRVFASTSGTGHNSGNVSGTDTPAVARPVLAEGEVGWGLGRFGIREHEESARRLQAAGERLRDERLLGNDGDAEAIVEGGEEEERIGGEHALSGEDDRDDSVSLGLGPVISRRSTQHRRDVQMSNETANSTAADRAGEAEILARTEAGPSSRGINRVSRSGGHGGAAGLDPHAQAILEAVQGAQPTEGLTESDQDQEQDQDPTTSKNPGGASDWEDIDGSSSSSSSDERRRNGNTSRGIWRRGRGQTQTQSQTQAQTHATTNTTAATATLGTVAIGGGGNRNGNGGGGGDGQRQRPRWSWWGPLKEWRLADRSVF